MEADWEVEIGGGAPVIEAEWSGSAGLSGSSGYIDLRSKPARIVEIAEAAAFPQLGTLLLALNAEHSPLWTSKCDLWEPEPAVLASYVDMLPREGKVFASWQLAEAFCREYVARLAKITPSEFSPGCSIDLVIRQAVAGDAEGFGVTAYLSARAACRSDAEAALTSVMAIFADALPPAMPNSKLQ
jgi:hypothetical protein